MAAPPSTANNLPKAHVFRLENEFHYLSSSPSTPVDLLFLALHGYGMNAQTMLELTANLLGPRAIIASIQAPNQFYLRDNPAHSAVGYNWGTRAHGNAAIALHHDMVRYVARQMQQRFLIPPSRTILLGFSQPVGFNYRFAATFPQEIGAVIGICGGVPKDWESGHYREITAPILHIAREEDEYFPPAVTTDYPRKLRTRAADVEFHMLSGGHRFPSKGRSVVYPWLKRIFSVDLTASPADEPR